MVGSCAVGFGERSCLKVGGRGSSWPLLARISTEDQFQFGIHIFLAGLQAQQPTPKQRPTNHQIRSLMLYLDLVGSRPIWPAHNPDGSSVQMDPDRSCRIVWMIKQGSQFGRASPMTASVDLSRACGSSPLMLDDH
jgi:hypothetical protein